MNRICEVCEKEIKKGTGEEFLDEECSRIFWLCDNCFAKEINNK